MGAIGGMIYDAANGNDFGTSIWTWTKAGFGIGAIGGAMGSVTSGGIRIGLRVSSVLLSGGFEMMRNYYTGTDLMHNVVETMLISGITQLGFGISDAYAGKFSTQVLQQYKIDGALNFNFEKKGMLGLKMLGKAIWRSDEEFKKKLKNDLKTILFFFL